MVMHELEEAIVNYGPMLMAKQLRGLNILNSASYQVMTALMYLEDLDRATILIDLISDNIINVTNYQRFKTFLKTKTTFEHIYYQLIIIGKEIVW